MKYSSACESACRKMDSRSQEGAYTVRRVLEFAWWGLLTPLPWEPLLYYSRR
jgi:hypothetical protein